MTLKALSSTSETQRKAVVSAAQTVGQGREIPYGYRNPSFKDYADVIVALVCLAAILGTAYFAVLDSNYSTTMRITEAIQRLLGEKITGNAVDTRKTILVVEKDEGQRLVAKTTLERYGFNVALADNGAEAAALFRKAAGRVALIVVDTHGSNAEALRTLHAMRPAVPIVISEAAGEKLQVGVAARIDRPFSALPLAEVVQKLLHPRTI